MTGSPNRAIASCSAALTYEPVGLFGIDDEDGARAIGQRVAQTRRAIDLPSLMKLEREVVQLDQLQRGEMFEQRIRRRRGEHRIAGIAEEFEEKRIRLAGRRGDDDVARVARELARDRLARGRDPERLRIVRRARGAGHDLGELIERIVRCPLSSDWRSSDRAARRDTLARERERLAAAFQCARWRT